MTRNLPCVSLWKILPTLPSKRLLGQIIGIDVRTARNGYSLGLWLESLRPLKAFIQKPCKDLSLLEVCDIADLVCLKSIFHYDFAVVLQLLDLFLPYSLVHPYFLMRKHSERDLIWQNGKSSGGSSCKDNLVLQEGHFGFLPILVVKVVEAIAGWPENQAHVYESG